MNKLNSMKALLSVVDPEYSNVVSSEELTRDDALLKSAIKLAEKNGLYYYFIHGLKERGVDIPSSEKDRWDEENQRLSELKETLSLLNKVSTDYGVDYVIIKACNTIPHIPRDIDVFVRNEDRAKIINALENNGMECIQSGITETSLKGDYMKVDIYTEICYIGVDFMDGDFLLRSSVKDEVFGVGCSGLNNEANLLLLLVHSLFGHRSISLLDFLHIKHIRSDIDMDMCREYAHERGWESVFDLVLNELDTLHKRISEGGEVISFPYLFGRELIWKCVSGIKGLDMDKCDKTFLHLTLAQDRAIYELKDTSIYNLLKSCEPARNLINSLTASIKSRRGDRKSIGK